MHRTPLIKSYVFSEGGLGGVGGGQLKPPIKSCMHLCNICSVISNIIVKLGILLEVKGQRGLRSESAWTLHHFVVYTSRPKAPASVRMKVNDVTPPWSVSVSSCSIRRSRQPLSHVPYLIWLPSNEPSHVAGFLANYGCGTSWWQAVVLSPSP